MRDHSRASGPLQYDNDFWRFSLAVYGQAEVAEECLLLQRELGIDVNLLLFCAWLGTRAVTLSAKDIEGAWTAVSSWHERVVRPLREVRQWIKTLSREEFESFRGRVNEAELDAEQIEQAILFAHSKQIQGLAGADRNEAIARNVNQYLRTKSPVRAPEPCAPRLIDAARRSL
ncbi:MAG TPA: TIGR02444 family protein [Pseudolabrys sp.]|nr:TIGR02444 family protein [Pseudolabrys sp.]